MSLFHDRRDAGQQLAARLRGLFPTPESRVNLCVLGVPRGGVVVAAEIAKELGVPPDVWLTRKLGAPLNPELAIGAVAGDGTTYLDTALIRQLHIPDTFVAQEQAAQQQELLRRVVLYRRGRAPLELEGKTVILVDDGIATGATIIASLRALKQQKPVRRVLAVPVAPPRVVAMLRAECEDLVVLDTPEDFRAVGYFYEDFVQVSDEEVMQILGAN